MAAIATLLVAGFVGAPLIEIVPGVKSLFEAMRGLVYLGLFGLAGTIGGIAASFTRAREGVAGRALLAGAIVAALPPVIGGLWDASLMRALAALLTAGWGAALAGPTVPLAGAVVETKSAPSLDALDRVFAMAGGFLFSVKVPEAIVAALLNERPSALICGGLAAAGAAAFAIFQRRRAARAARARALQRSDDDAVELVEEADAGDEAPLLSGTGRLIALRRRDGAAYREGTQAEILAVLAREPIWPAPRADATRVLRGLCLAGFLGLVAYGVALVGMST